MDILLATGNLHKKEELAAILQGHKLLLPGDLGLTFEFEETGSTFYENSLGKALHLHNLSGRPVLADDSRLCVSALNGAPGIYSARYGTAEHGRPLTDGERNDFLLTNLRGQADRTAFFVCCMTLVFNPYRIYSIQETMDGKIIEAATGTGGFGYDPVFYLPEYGKTVAELPEGEKNRISHRGKAGKTIKSLLDTL